MGSAATLFNGAESFDKIINILSTKDPIWNLVKIVQDVSPRRLKISDFILVHSIGARADNPKILKVAKQFTS